MSDSHRLVEKFDSFRNLLRDDGVGVLDYIEQLTYLLFLKIAHERATRKLKPQQIVPETYSWQRLLDAEGVPESALRRYTGTSVEMAEERSKDLPTADAQTR